MTFAVAAILVVPPSGNVRAMADVVVDVANRARSGSM